MLYPLGEIVSLTDGNLTVNSANTYFSVLVEDNEVILNGEKSKVNIVYSDIKFSVKTAFSTWTAGDMIYTEDKCVYLRYQIWKIENAILNYDMRLLGVKRLESDREEVEYFEGGSTINELKALKADYERQLRDCEDAKNGTNSWVLRRYEYGTY